MILVEVASRWLTSTYVMKRSIYVILRALASMDARAAHGWIATECQGKEAASELCPTAKEAEESACHQAQLDERILFREPARHSLEPTFLS